MALAAAEGAGELKRARRPRRARADARHARDVSFLAAAGFGPTQLRVMFGVIALAVALLSLAVAMTGRESGAAAATG